MKIKSSWRDFYDHVAHMYGGGDPKVIYNRDYVVPDRVSHGERYEDNLSIPSKVWTPSIPHDMKVSAPSSSTVQSIEFRSLIVMDRHFILERQSDIGEMGVATVRKDWHITTRRIINTTYRAPTPLLRNDEMLTVGASRYERARMQELLDDPMTDRMRIKQGTKEPKAKELCEFVKAPIFVVEGNRAPVVFGRTPKLSSLGVAAYIQPQQLYQELAMFVGNVLNPVEQPPSMMNDIEKVSSHGFDKKISFRHRK